MDRDEVKAALDQKDDQIADLEMQLAELRQELEETEITAEDTQILLDDRNDFLEAIYVAVDERYYTKADKVVPSYDREDFLRVLKALVAREAA